MSTKNGGKYGNPAKRRLTDPQAVRGGSIIGEPGDALLNMTNAIVMEDVAVSEIAAARVGLWFMVVDGRTATIDRVSIGLLLDADGIAALKTAVDNAIEAQESDT